MADLTRADNRHGHHGRPFWPPLALSRDLGPRKGRPMDAPGPSSPASLLRYETSACAQAILLRGVESGRGGRRAGGRSEMLVVLVLLSPVTVVGRRRWRRRYR